MSPKMFIFLILLIIFSFTINSSKVPESDLNKAVSCLHVLSKKFKEEIDQKTYSSNMLACFSTITDIDAKEVLVAAQQEMNFLSPEEINKLTDVENIKKIEKSKINEISQRLQNALKEFDDIRNNYKKEDKSKTKNNHDYNEDEDYKRAHPSHGNKLGKFMKGMTSVLKLFNNFGKIIIVVMIIYFVAFIIKNRKKKFENVYSKYTDYNTNKSGKNSKNKKKKKNE